jgi:hypothetical protein
MRTNEPTVYGDNRIDCEPSSDQGHQADLRPNSVGCQTNELKNPYHGRNKNNAEGWRPQRYISGRSLNRYKDRLAANAYQVDGKEPAELLRYGADSEYEQPNVISGQVVTGRNSHFCVSCGTTVSAG